MPTRPAWLERLHNSGIFNTTIIDRYSLELKHKAPGEVLRIKSDEKNTARARSRAKLFARQIAEQIGLTTTPTMEQLQKIGKRISERVKFVPVDKKTAMFAYGKVPAEKAIELGRIPVLFVSGKAAFGCGMISDTAIAILSQLSGIKNIKHVRTVNDLGYPHSIVYFEVPFKTPEGKTASRRYIMDLFNTQPEQRIAQVGEELTIVIEKLKQAGLWKEGKSLSDFNKNYASYEAESKRTREKIATSEKAREALMMFIAWSARRIK